MLYTSIKARRAQLIKRTSRRILNQVLFAITLIFLSACAHQNKRGPVTDEINESMDTLVSVEWLRANIDEPDLVIIDATVLVEADGTGNFINVNGRSNYESGHIPGAVFADLMGELSDGSSSLSFR